MKPIEEQVLAIVALVILTGCAVGPNYKQPQISVAASFANPPTNVISADEAKLAAWWQGFEDVKLNDLVARAITHNHDVRIATANLKEARAERRLARFDLVPTVQAEADNASTLLNKSAAPHKSSRGRRVESYEAGFDATWELDFFGRVRRSVEAAGAQYEATDARRLDVLRASRLRWRASISNCVD